MQYQWSSTCAYYGIENEEPAIQHLGKVTTPQGRLLAFPNVMQHQVQPFRLADATKPGHRKILAMFLVDPHIPILSTANVPPQRKDWWAQEVRKVEPFASLPEELFQNIIELVDGFPISWQDALEIREKLMEERGRMTDGVNEAMEEVSSQRRRCAVMAFLTLFRTHSISVNIEITAFIELTPGGGSNTRDESFKGANSWKKQKETLYCRSNEVAELREKIIPDGIPISGR